MTPKLSESDAQLKKFLEEDNLHIQTAQILGIFKEIGSLSG